MDKDREQIVVGSDQSPAQRQLTFQSYQQPSPSGTTASGRAPAQKRYELIDGQWVQLTAAGLPRKKPGRKPGSTVKPKTTDGTDPAKARKPRKPRDPNAPPLQRKRKMTTASDADGDSDASRTPSGQHVNVSSPSQQHLLLGASDQRGSPKMPKREGYPGSMQSILNADPPSTSIPVRSSGLSYDPIRGNYDPVRETITSHSANPYSSTSGSPRGPTQAANRSPSIASMIEPQARTATSPSLSQHGQQTASAHGRLHGQDSSSVPPSPSYKAASVLGTRPGAADPKKESAVATIQRPVINQANFTTISNGPIRRASPKLKPTTGVSTPRTDTLDDFQDSEGRSILDFGKARPGEEFQAPTIVLNIPIKAGETNKYVNFMRLAEDRYGWDALHPRQAANRDRKARIEAATASLEKAELGRESGDEMSLDNSDGEASNPENGGTSGPDAQVKPKKKRNFKEDQYDVDDDFVDDSELLWEAQAAASRDGFFVYSGPLVPEVEKPAIPHERPKRGRGSRGARGSRGSTRGGTGTGRGGGPGSRGGTVTRKPRITKAERLQREREKAERESMAQINKTPTNGYVLQPSTPAFSVSELGA
ncbi:histone promoter control 2 (HPC2) [Pochonia chlamydosporia 170]|uniref:Histone promoter control 2 (HPC2) n=1 Tax=Pochonia chlamydosporia 170 TaxID=1380566 RepID=A0A179FN63_METCM|nr:histone promoter control 2 (HPC2) [Pochonia chlamydosporia 170]OAQ66591.1 histone promoter control 2 (HPC2) [Pochonia chlamydosporia 170]